MRRHIQLLALICSTVLISCATGRKQHVFSASDLGLAVAYPDARAVWQQVTENEYEVTIHIGTYGLKDRIGIGGFSAARVLVCPPYWIALSEKYDGVEVWATEKQHPKADPQKLRYRLLHYPLPPGKSESFLEGAVVDFRTPSKTLDDLKRGCDRDILRDYNMSSE